jgi:hypothetical protein
VYDVGAVSVHAGFVDDGAVGDSLTKYPVTEPGTVNEMIGTVREVEVAGREKDSVGARVSTMKVALEVLGATLPSGSWAPVTVATEETSTPTVAV